MARGIGETAFRALTRSGSASLPPNDQGYAEAEVLWGHATSPVRLAVLQDISERLSLSRPDLLCVLTADPRRVDLSKCRETPTLEIVPVRDDLPSSARRFMDHYSPDVCVWTGGYLRRGYLGQAALRDVSLILADADEAGFAGIKRGLFSSPVAATLDLFSTIYTDTRATATLMERLGASQDRVSVTGPLTREGSPAPCDEADLAHVSQVVAGRQLWFAAEVTTEEIDAVIQAHRHAVRLSHRLLLVVSPGTGANTEIMRNALSFSGLRWGEWTHGMHLDDTVQVLFSEDREDLELWYRVVPLSFVGNSLWQGGDGCDPLVPAALGSAILHGPHVKHHSAAYDRLIRAGAARLVREPSNMGDIVLQLIAPDRAAAMALAGWDIATQGANVSDRLIDLVQDILDTREAMDARA